MTTALIGRDHPAGLLRAEIGRAVDSHGGLVLVTGEAGIGKTTLVTQAAEEARRQGALVLGGSCWDSDSTPGYWPWVQVIRALRRAATPEEWAAAAEASAGGLPILLGESRGTEEVEAFRLYDAVTSALVAVSQHRPVLVVLDDLHWADTASLRLLEFAAQHTWFERLLLVGTYRDAEVEAVDHPLRPLLASLTAKATSVTLTGLGVAEVAALMTRTAGREPGPELAAEVHRRTGGNPFFVEQTARLWLSGGAITATAPGVRDALDRRLSLLPAPVVELLTAAAVLGREFHPEVLAAVTGAPPARVDRLLGQAMAARLVVTGREGRLAFVHDLVRESLYDALGEAEARRRHAAVVRALDAAPAAAARVLPTEQARHAHLAGDALDPGRAVDLLLAAARDAAGRMALEESAGHHRRALRLASEPARRALISIDLAHQLHHLGERDAAWELFEQAVAIAQELEDDRLLARVALLLQQTRDGSERDRLREELLAEAHRRLVGTAPAPGERPSPDRLMRELTLRIASLARSGDDDEELAFSLWMRHDAIWGLGSAAERKALTAEVMALAHRIGDRNMELFASSLRWVALVELGDPGYADQHRSFIALAEATGSPRFQAMALVDQALIHLFTGRFAEAEACYERACHGFPGEKEQPWWTFVADHLRWSLLLLQGRFAEIAELLRTLDGHPHPELLAGVTALQRGDVSAALRHLPATALGDDAYSRLFVPLALRFQAHAAAASRNAELCERARAALEPHGGQWMVSLFGNDISGPVDLWLGLLDAAQERWAAAVDRLTAAYRSADRLQARPWSVEARCHLAETLLARGAAGDAEQAAALLGEVEREAAELGMRHIADRVRRARSAAAAAPAGGTANGTRPAPGAANAGPDAGTASADPDAAGADAAPVAEFRRDGAVWSLRFAGRAAHVPDAKGLRDLHTLLSRPGADVPAVRLLDPAGGEVVAAARRLGGDAVLDEEAKARYRRRLTLLDEEIDRAVALGEDRRAAALDEERAALLRELRAAAGLGGRTRRLGDEAERARKTVTARIRDTLRRLDRLHPELAAHLRASVSTGATCRYLPDREIHWRL